MESDMEWVRNKDDGDMELWLDGGGRDFCCCCVAWVHNCAQLRFSSRARAKCPGLRHMGSTTHDSEESAMLFVEVMLAIHRYEEET